MKEKLRALRASLQCNKAWRAARYVLLAFFIPFIWAVTEMFNYEGLSKYFRFIGLHPGSAALAFCVTALLFAAFLFAVRRGWIAAAILGALYLICGYVNFIKTALNGEHFTPWDLAMAGKMGQLLSFTRIRLPWWAYVVPFIVAAFVWVLWFLGADLKTFGKWDALWRPIGTLLMLALLILPFAKPKWAEKTLKKFGMSFMDAALQSSNYRANGFVGAFTLNLVSMNVEAPEGYDEDAVKELLGGFSGTEGTGKTPDVICILCESFWDIRNLPGTTFSKDPLAYYDALCEMDNAYSGTFYSSATGGGTVRPEFEVLTGLTTDFLPAGTVPYQYVKSPFPNYVSNYKEQGYTTLAMHPYDKTFYSRSSAYGAVGFDAYYGDSEIAEMVDVTYKRGYISDDSFADAMIKQLEAHKNEPTFLFGISMENHQTYYALQHGDIEITVDNPALSGATKDAVTTYTQGAYHACQMMEKLVNYINSRGKDTVLVLFGDHLPTLGPNFDAYRAAGLFDGEAADTAEAKLMYGTPFVVYANYDMESGILKKKGNEISPYYLLDAVALSTGTARTPYMDLLLERFGEVPYYNSRLMMKKTKAVKALRRTQELITYDRVFGKQYSK